MKKSASVKVSEPGVASVRVIVGVLLVIHGAQVFQTDDMREYGPWMADLGVPFPLVLPYIGKIIEFLGGVAFITGLFLKPACILLMLTFLFIVVVMGGGKILTDAQHSFMFFLFSVLFYFAGDSGYSLRRLLL
ncbi:MAG TPA: DoxX family protein [Chryseosolibacter sp.]